ncbi:class I SAM-dependent methyltransferase [candidate division WOR-3 bacterium]|nr:class I SAM-dependent methyltransferase [candidate division WOR-3 bacterium]
MDEKIKANMYRWNDMVDVHARSSHYDLDGFRKGRNTLNELVLKGVGDVKGKSLLHLQCHFGMDTLSWARLGAEVTGADFSPKAIDLARSLSRELGIPATFVCSEVDSLPENLAGKEDFDIVFTSEGVLCWLPDLKGWARVIAHFLKPGGIFYIQESHPFGNIFADEEVEDFQIGYSYFKKPATRFEEQGSYADPDAIVEHTESFEWMHTMGEIINSLISAGLRIESLNEYPYIYGQRFPFLVKKDKGIWGLPGDREDVPIMFELKARK